MRPLRRPRNLTEDDHRTPRPVYAVWEVTLRCDHACGHCGSRAQTARPNELSIEEMRDVADQLARLGCREVTLIGGEAYLRPDLDQLIAHLTRAGVSVGMQTGGLSLTERRLKSLLAAGLGALGVSVDGPASAHDILRARPGSWRLAMKTIRLGASMGLTVNSNTQINQLTLPHLRETADALEEAGVRTWRVQLTVPMGRAADRPEWLLQPWQVVPLMDELAALKLERLEAAHAAGAPPSSAMDITLANSVGYYGPHEHLLRSAPGIRARAWQGCQAGRFTIGIESDGKVKACPSLPTVPYVGGNIRDLTLSELWHDRPELRFARDRTIEELWGFCKGCYYADVCRAGCSFTTHCFLGRRGNNPFCYHRAQTLAKEGVRERLVQVEKPAGVPYDYGRFELKTDPLPGAPSPQAPSTSSTTTLQ